MIAKRWTLVKNLLREITIYDIIFIGNVFSTNQTASRGASRLIYLFTQLHPIDPDYYTVIWLIGEDADKGLVAQELITIADYYSQRALDGEAL